MLAQTAETREQARSDVRTALPGWLADGLAGYRPIDGKPRQPRDPLAYTDFLCDVHELGDPADCARRIRDHTARTGIHHIILMVEAPRRSDGDVDEHRPPRRRSAAAAARPRPQQSRSSGLWLSNCPRGEMNARYRSR
jgi:hypothetical protein